MHEELGSPIDLVVLTSKLSDWNRFNTRYGGLFEELHLRDITVAVAQTKESYLGNGVFGNTIMPLMPLLGSIEGYLEEGNVRPKVVRDLNMPKEVVPLYIDENAPKIIQDPSINLLLKSKSNVYDLMSDLQPRSIGHVVANEVEEAVSEISGSMIVIKPDTGSGGDGVLIGDKKTVVEAYRLQEKVGLYIVQEAIDMTKGLEEHHIKGVHNIRFIVIGGAAIFGFVRNVDSDSLTMQGETFTNRTFLRPEGFSDNIQDVLQRSQDKFKTVPFSHDTVLAFDVIRGINSDNEQREYLLEVNRRPERNSPYDGRNTNTLWASHAWDSAEAEMLHGALTSL
jgi:hypothetical protein